jgi:hypothetical protein
VVTNIHLPKRQLTGPLPWSLALLRNVTELDFDHNFLTGTLPQEWGCLEQLIEIDLSENRLAGTLPMQWGLLHKYVRPCMPGGARPARCTLLPITLLERCAVG